MAATRRLAAIMFTDTVGYTASVQSDEAATLELLRIQQELLRPLFTLHKGREIKSTGDGFMVEFDSALQAAQCAVDIQRRIHARNAAATPPAIQIRIGIHLGDVEERGPDILGDAVNIAARIEPMAEPGGICLSASVREQIWNKLPDRLEKLPPTVLKGLQIPMEVYKIVLTWDHDPASPSSVTTGLAVLPFSSISPDSKDEYFAEGLTEEVITVLSQLSGLRVISRTSVMQYKSTTKSARQIGAELSVTSILEGSVRKAGNRLRVTAQLIDAASDRHLWAQSYDRELDDIFQVQSELAKSVAEVLKVTLITSEETRLDTKPRVLPDSYLAYLQGRACFNAEWSEESFRRARELFDRALSLDSNNARAHSGLADVIRYIHYSAYPGADPDWDRTSRAHAARAIELDPDLAEAHCTLGSIHWDNFEYVDAEKEMQLALSLNPSYSQAHKWYGHLLMDQTRGEEALRELKFAEMLDPQSSMTAAGHVATLITLRKMEEASLGLERLRELDHGGPRYLEELSSYYYALGDLSEMSRAIDELEKINPMMARTERIWLLAARGQKEEARRLLQEREAGPIVGSATSIAAGYAVLGDLDACFRILDRAIDDRNVALQLIRNDPALEPMRRDPRFMLVLKRMNLA